MADERSNHYLPERPSVQKKLRQAVKEEAVKDKPNLTAQQIASFLRTKLLEQGKDAETAAREASERARKMCKLD